MAASGGGGIPLPPKRPTIIRQGQQREVDGEAAVEPRIPARPAPPVPGGRPAVPRPQQAGNNAPLPVPPRPGERPSRPTSITSPSKSLPPPPSKPANSRQATVKKRPEITIVAAKPMTEVGFRDNKPSAGSTSKPLETDDKPLIDFSEPDPKPAPVTVPRVSPWGSKIDHKENEPIDLLSTVNADKPRPVRKPPPPRTSVQDTNIEAKENQPISTGINDKPRPVRNPPPPVPKHTGVKRSTENVDSTSLIDLNNTDSGQDSLFSFPKQDSVNKPSVPAPPVRPTVIRPTSVPPKGPIPPLPPSRPSLEPRQLAPSTPQDKPESTGRTEPDVRLPPPVPKHRYNDIENAVNDNENKPAIVSDSKDKGDEDDNTSQSNAVYSVIDKPKRPTIIRPAKPNLTPSQEVNGPKETVDDGVDSIEAPKPRVIPSPRLPRKPSNPEQRDSIQKTEPGSSHGNDSEQSDVPEFLRKKLRSTVDNEANNARPESNELGQGEKTKGPPTPLKPKPLVTPKPQVVAKPNIGDKPSVLTKPLPPLKNSNTNPADALPDNSEAQSVSTDKTEEKEIQSTGSDTQPSINPQSSFKRPTIIRSSKPALSESAENVSSDNSLNLAPTILQSADDSVCAMRQPKPLPARRPMSMMNVSSNANKEASTSQPSFLNELVHQQSSKRSVSSENINESSETKPVPRPVPRTRPASMAVPTAIRPPLPREGPRIDDTKLGHVSENQSTGPPAKPAQRPPPPKPSPPKPSPPKPKLSHPDESRPGHQKDEDVQEHEALHSTTPLPEPSPTKPQQRKSIHNIGVSVFPGLNPPSADKPRRTDASEDSDHHSSEVKGQGSEVKGQESVTPPRPSQRPPPPVAAVKPNMEGEMEMKGAPVLTESSEEEFVSARDRPERPPGPRRESPQVARRGSGGDGKPLRPAVAPGRPGHGPSNAQTSHTDSQDNDDVKKRPPRPGGGPKTPVSDTSSAPPKPSPPKPGAGPKSAPGHKGLPPLPSRPGPGHPLYHHMMSTPHCIALHGYTGLATDELTFKTDDVIILVRRVDEQWLVGRLGDHEGMFPSNHVQVAMPLPGEKPDKDDAISSSTSEDEFFDATAEKPDTLGHGPRCRARFDFDGEGPDDLVFEDGDVIRLLERVGPEWMKGELSGHQGLFPLAYVEIIEDLPAVTTAQAGSDQHMAKAVFDFDGEDGELSFQAGEMITVTHFVNEEWLYGELGSRKGQFPVQFIDHVPTDLSPLISGQSDTKGNNSTEHSAPAGHVTTSTVMWDQHDEKVLQPPSPVETSLGAGQDHFATNEPHALGQGLALYDYPGETDEDLAFQAGDRIQVLETVGQDWLRGKLGTRVGIFPAAFVELEPDHGSSDHSQTTPESVHSEPNPGIEGIAMYDFAGETMEELIFHAGDRVMVEQPVEGAPDWSWGHFDGKRGMFPTAYVDTH